VKLLLVVAPSEEEILTLPIFCIHDNIGRQSPEPPPPPVPSFVGCDTCFSEGVVPRDGSLL
jgi:hypothetical protein